MSNKAPNIVLPQGGGALSGMGEKFSADLFTGTGNFSVPIALPQGRNGFEPHLTLGYSSGSGNGPWGLGWSIAVPGVMRKVDRGIPTYDDDADIFILSGFEDLVPISTKALTNAQGATTGYSVLYKPRTEGLFARIEHIKDSVLGNYWQVRTKDGLISYYGTPAALKNDPSIIANPNNRNDIFAWRLSKTVDPFGNQIVYSYMRDLSYTQPHVYDQLYLSQIQYCDYGDPANPSFLVQVNFNYEDRPDAFSTYKQGFEVRTKQRCNSLEIYTNAASLIKTKTYHFNYLDETSPAAQIPLNKVSMLASVQVEGHDGDTSEWMPPLEMSYSDFQPQAKTFYPVNGFLPSTGLGTPQVELVDMNGNGLPDILEMNGSVRWYRNLGNATFQYPIDMPEAPGGLNLGDPNVQMLDANGDGRPDLLVNRPGLSGYYATKFAEGWNESYFQAYAQAPSFSFSDPNVKLMDIDGDGITDALRINTVGIQCFFNDRIKGFYKTSEFPTSQLDGVGNLDFSDPRMRLADMTGDGMQDIVMLYYNQISYWPNLGYGRFGKRVVMKSGISLPFNFDPKRILVGDVDGDGCADIVYVENGTLRLWINQCGNGFSNEILIKGTPQISNIDSVRLSDLNGSGVSGILYTAPLSIDGKTSFFLDFTAGNKPYLMQQMNNNMGSLTQVEYKSSLYYYLQDEQNPETRWNTELPFPVLVVSKVESIDQISQGKLTTTYTYHHGYWDGFEREFRGFGRVEQMDSEIFEQYNSNGLAGNTTFNNLSYIQFTPPTLTKNWFHQGAMGDPFGGFYEADFSNEYWEGDPNGLSRPADVTAFLQSLSAWDKRDALRTLRGTQLRTELYAIDGTPQQAIPYTVSESVHGMRQEAEDQDLYLQKGNHRKYKIFFSYGISERTTQWERGDDPMTSVSLTGVYDDYGQPLSHVGVGVPRYTDWRKGGSTDSYLGTASQGVFIYVDSDDQYMVDRVLFSKEWDATATAAKGAIDYLNDLINAVTTDSVTLPVISHTISYYDGSAFTGLPYGEIGSYGAHIRDESLVITDTIIADAYSTVPPCFSGTGTPDWSAYPSDFVSALQDTKLGYLYKNTSNYITGYYICPSKSKYDFQAGTANPRGLVVVVEDTFGDQTTVDYDTYQLLPETVTDALGMQTLAQYDYRVLQPDMITDPNLNRTMVAFSPMGLLYKTAVQGKSTESKGDTLDHPSTFLEYDFFNFYYNQQPIWTKTSLRERHYYDDPTSPYIVKCDYSDGFGRLIQSRKQAEDTLFGNMPTGDSGLPASQSATNQPAIGIIRDSSAPLNVIVSGWQVYNNKGKVVEKFESFFSSGFDFISPGNVPYGQKTQMFYDPRGILIRTLHPDGTQEKLILGIPYDFTKPDTFQPTPWVSCAYDANDLDSSLMAFGTPKINYPDVLGRTVKTNESNKYYDYINSTDALQEITMHYTYDIRGNVLTITDALGRIAFSHVYDLHNKSLKSVQIDAGTNHLVHDALDRGVISDNANGAVVLSVYDQLSRMTASWAKDNTSSSYCKHHVLKYGDSSGLINPENENLKGKIYQFYDEAGLKQNDSYDFKGNTLSSTRQVIDPGLYANAITNSGGVWTVTPLRVDWGASTPPALDTNLYTIQNSYDALNRITAMIYPTANSDTVSTTRTFLPTYNSAGALESVVLQEDVSGTITNTTYVERIAYNARGQRLLISHGNGIMTRYVYDTRNFRLLRLKSEDYTLTTASYTVIYTPNTGTTIQDFAYTYDSLGNIMNISDQTPAGGTGGITGLNRIFDYDALYRLLKATGRENLPTPYNINPYQDNTRDTTANSTTDYTQYYAYDPMGNMLTLKHNSTVTGASFNRDFNYDTITNNNLLSSIDVWGTNYAFTYDYCGNQTLQNMDSHMLWDYADRMYSFYIQAGTSEPSQYAQYCYDSSGHRIMKIVRLSGGAYRVRIYINNTFEEYYEYDSTGVFQGYQDEIMITDNQSKIASKLIGTSYSGDIMGVKYIYADHLGSSNVQCNGSGALISREEYYPFGETSFGSYAKKRYRFCGKEKDEESGLYYYGARYYLSWTCRFISVDPLADHTPSHSSYMYAHNNPVMYIDPTGMAGEKAQPKTTNTVPKDEHYESKDRKPSFKGEKKVESREVDVHYTKVHGAIGKETTYTDHFKDGSSMSYTHEIKQLTAGKPFAHTKSTAKATSHHKAQIAKSKQQKPSHTPDHKNSTAPKSQEEPKPEPMERVVRGLKYAEDKIKPIEGTHALVVAPALNVPIAGYGKLEDKPIKVARIMNESFKSGEELATELKAFKTISKVADVVGKLGKAIGLLGIATSLAEIYNHPHDPTAYVKLGVNIGLLLLKENPAGLIISAASFIGDITGVNDKIEKKIGETIGTIGKKIGSWF